ncbi:MAG: YgdI/YgdR family lipoprotein, partial [Elusimicrobiota bacterium]|nr:YgdI/YgdR family lipoprotein [Elusimicrobiota bacterium]
MKTKTIILLSAAIFLICGCAGKQVIGESKPQTDEDDVLISMMSENQEFKNLFDKAAAGDADAQYQIGSWYSYAGKSWSESEFDSMRAEGQQYYSKA